MIVLNGYRWTCYHKAAVLDDPPFEGVAGKGVNPARPPL